MLKELQRHTLEECTMILSYIIKTRAVGQEHAAINKEKWENKTQLPKSETEAGCSQEDGPKKGFVMGSRTWGVQEILEKCV